jgi:hypothetical protein
MKVELSFHASRLKNVERGRGTSSRSSRQRATRFFRSPPWSLRVLACRCCETLTPSFHVFPRTQKNKNKQNKTAGTSDPFAVVTRIATTPNGKPEVIGKTEVIR